MATAALIVTGAISTGGLAAIAGKLRGPKRFKERASTSEPRSLNSRRDHHGEH
jgi:hypothetical protein